MSELNLEIDNTTESIIKDLSQFYNVTTAELISKGLTLLKIAAHVTRTHGQLIARKGLKETLLLT